MKPKLRPIREQVVVLVGATSGIGLETAKYMVEKGANVVIAGRSQEGLNEALEQVRHHAEASMMMRGRGANGHNREEMDMMGGGQNAGMNSTETQVTDLDEQVIALEGDVTNFEQMKSVAEQVVQRFGRIDTWVNVAAVSEWALFEDTSPDEFRRIIDVNLVGQAYGAMAALPYLKQQQGGALIFVSSVAGRLPIPYQTAYNASKHGVLGLADTLRQELRQTGVPVSVTTILPSSINTPLFEKARTKLGVEPNPIPPIYDVKMVAKAITYAADHPVRELIVGDAGYVATFMRRLAPTLTGNVIGATGFRVQRSNEPKSAQAPDNLYHHINGYDETQGEFTPQTKRISVLTWLSTHPTARMAIYGTMLTGLGLFVGWRMVEIRSERRGWRYRLPRQAKKLSKKAGKTVEKTIRDAGDVVVALPVVSSLPMFRKRTVFGKTADMVLGWWAAISSISLPFLTSRKSVINRIAEWIPDINMPWNRKASTLDRLTMAEQRKVAMKRIAKQSDKIMDQVGDSRKKAQKAASKTADRIDDRRKDVVKSASRRMPSMNDVKDMADKVTSKDGEVVRKRTYMEKTPSGELREVKVERIQSKK